MHIFFNIFGRQIPAYGLLIVLGAFIANVIGYFLVKHEKKSFDDFMLVEAYCILGGFLGAKILYLIVTFNDIEWNRIFEADYFNAVMKGGFVFYGGLIGGAAAALLAGKLHKLEISYYFTHCIFLIPFIHGFGRVGCFMAGCCYGVPYDGPLAVVFPDNSLALHGVKLFPVQIVEAVFLIIISMIVLFLTVKIKSRFTVEAYLLLYSVLRFILENYRYDPERGYFMGVSTSQWISILLFTGAIISIVYRTKIKPAKTENEVVEEH
ncbi:MAG: prolipoprotein diacylglyceryl transferase [Clostridiales bacterium]|nr:prolipoprotein diacylglyceryl transferase [Clostridiales bacterium]